VRDGKPRGPVVCVPEAKLTAEDTSLAAGGPVERDRGNGESAPGDGELPTIGGTAYERGLGTHADSAVEVYADDKRVYAGAAVKGTDPAVPVEADVSGARKLRLRVTDGGDGNAHDHADWAAATVRCAPAPAR